MDHVWKIYDLKRIIADGMVIQATYACESKENNASTRYVGDIELTTGSISDPGFITYDNLTQDNVLGWVAGSIDTASIETENSASIAKNILQRSKITKRNGTPW
tara:strand:- start:2762 stop:3073 length:312 start_codon:yes stop_codon:yes gene_type:complete